MQSGLAAIIALGASLNASVLPSDKELGQMASKVKSRGWKPLAKHVDEGYELKDKSITRTSSKISRNSPCPCGSGKKYKKCHLDTTPK